MKSQAEFAIHFDGNSEIDAQVLSRTINEMARLTQMASKQVDPDAYIKLNVTAFRNGSFQIDYTTIFEAANTLFTYLPQVSSTANTVIQTLRGFFEIKKHLKGKAAKEVNKLPNDEIEIVNADGSKIKTSKSSATIINNVQIDQIVVNLSNSMLEHNADGGFTFSSKDGTEHFNSSDVLNMSRSLPVSSNAICRRSHVSAILFIKKADLLGRSQWQFYWNDKKIDAAISDDDFLESVHSELAIKAGDYINATLVIYTELDFAGTLIEGSEKYNVIKVHGSINHQKDGQYTI